VKWTIPSEPLVLRSPHLPEPIGWWPLAPGWLLLAVLLLLLLWLAIRLRRNWRAGALRRAARAEFHAIRSAWQQQRDERALLRDLSALLRRVALATQPREAVAALHGAAWLAWLDQGLPERRRGGFSEGPGRVLGDAQWQPELSCEPKPLLRLTRVWLMRATQPKVGL